MSTVLISGLGLIGSSIARTIRDGDRKIEIIGSDPDDDSAQFLLDQQIINIRKSFEEAAIMADFIVLAGPVSVIVAQIHALQRLSLKPDVFITDVGSTKKTIMKAAQPLLAKGINFVGGHPMAGSDKSGGRFGTLNLFKNAIYFLVGKSQTNRKLADYQQLLSKSMIRWQPITAAAHDQLVSELSHLPHVVAVTLVNTITDSLDEKSIGLKAAAGGFKDTTRIAASDPTMWTTIMMNNTEQISRALSQFQQHLAKFQAALDTHDEATIKAFFARARASRKSIDERK